MGQAPGSELIGLVMQMCAIVCLCVSPGSCTSGLIEYALRGCDLGLWNLSRPQTNWYLLVLGWSTLQLVRLGHSRENFNAAIGDPHQRIAWDLP